MSSILLSTKEINQIAQVFYHFFVLYIILHNLEIVYMYIAYNVYKMLLCICIFCHIPNPRPRILPAKAKPRD